MSTDAIIPDEPVDPDGPDPLDDDQYEVKEDGDHAGDDEKGDQLEDDLEDDDDDDDTTGGGS